MAINHYTTKLSEDIHLLLEGLPAQEAHRLSHSFIAGNNAQKLFEALRKHIPPFRPLAHAPRTWNERLRDRWIGEIAKFCRNAGIETPKYAWRQLFETINTYLGGQAAGCAAHELAPLLEQDPVCGVQYHYALARAYESRGFTKLADELLKRGIDLARSEKRMPLVYEGMQIKLWQHMELAEHQVSKGAKSLLRKAEALLDQLFAQRPPAALTRAPEACREIAAFAAKGGLQGEAPLEPTGNEDARFVVYRLLAQAAQWQGRGDSPRARQLLERGLAIANYYDLVEPALEGLRRWLAYFADRYPAEAPWFQEQHEMRYTQLYWRETIRCQYWPVTDNTLFRKQRTKERLDLSRKILSSSYPEALLDTDSRLRLGSMRLFACWLTSTWDLAEVFIERRDRIFRQHPQFMRMEPRSYVRHMDNVAQTLVNRERWPALLDEMERLKSETAQLPSSYKTELQKAQLLIFYQLSYLLNNCRQDPAFGDRVGRLADQAMEIIEDIRLNRRVSIRYNLGVAHLFLAEYAVAFFHFNHIPKGRTTEVQEHQQRAAAALELICALEIIRSDKKGDLNELRKDAEALRRRYEDWAGIRPWEKCLLACVRKLLGTPLSRHYWTPPITRLNHELRELRAQGNTDKFPVDEILIWTGRYTGRDLSAPPGGQP